VASNRCIEFINTWGGIITAFCACELILLFCDVFCLLVLLVCSNQEEWDGQCVARMGDRLGAYGVFVGRPEGKRSHRKYKPRCRDDIKMHLQKVGWVGMERNYLAQDKDRWRALVNEVMNLRVP
jgi:hypothetical protein